MCTAAIERRTAQLPVRARAQPAMRGRTVRATVRAVGAGTQLALGGLRKYPREGLARLSNAVHEHLAVEERGPLRHALGRVLELLAQVGRLQRRRVREQSEKCILNAQHVSMPTRELAEQHLHRARAKQVAGARAVRREERAAKGFI